jgi:hypothetical protein
VKQLELKLYPEEIDVDGIVDERLNIQYIGKASQRNDGKWVCLAYVYGAGLCLVEVTIRKKEKEKETINEPA